MSSVYRHRDLPSQERRQHLLHRVQKLLKQRTPRETALDELSALRALLETLPLAADEFALACRRVSNAHRYLLANEWGAARYELRMLTGALREASEFGRPTLRVESPQSGV